MKRLYILNLVMLLSMACLSQQWTEVASLPSNAERHHPITFSINGMGYSLMGSDSNDFPRDEVYRYDPQADNWTQLEDFPGLPRSFSYGVSDGEFAYLGFGLNGELGQVLNDLWRFDPATEEWTELASCPCLARFHPAFIYVDGKIFVGAGGSAIGNLNDWWEYDIQTDSWTEHPDIPGLTRHHPFYFGLNGDAYVGFGHGDTQNNSVQIYNDFYRWNSDTESWTVLDDFPGEARVAGTQFSDDGFGYLLSGDGDDHDFMNEGEFWQYDPVAESWDQLPSHPGFSRWAPGSFVIDGEVYFAQGQERFNQFPFSSLANDLWKYDLDLYNSALSISETEEKTELTIHPNPGTDIISISSDSDHNITAVSVLDFMGRVVLENAGNTSFLDISGLSTGSYIIKAQSDLGITHIQFIKE